MLIASVDARSIADAYYCEVCATSLLSMRQSTFRAFER